VAKLALPENCHFQQSKALQLQLHFYQQTKGLPLHYIVVVVAKLALPELFFLQSKLCNYNYIFSDRPRSATTFYHRSGKACFA
jgi:hypothetical protein